METGRQCGENLWQDCGWQSGRSHICMWINWEEQLGSETDQATQGTSTGKQSLKTTDLRNLWGLRWGKKLTASWEKSLERPTGS